jgi:hypothetical protein
MMIQRNENETPTWLDRMILLLVVVFFVGFLAGLAVHDRIFLQNPGHAVWKSVFLLK